MTRLHRIQIAVALILAASVGCKSLPDALPIATSPIEFGDNEWRVTDQTIVITDASGTQWQNETFPIAKALTQSFVSAMPAADAPAANPRNYAAGAIGFGGEDRMMAPLAPFDRRALASNSSGLEIMGDINGMGGTTPLHEVFNEVTQYLSGQSGRAAIVLFTDGLPTDEPEALAAAGALVESYSDEVCIHATQTGDDADGRVFLQSLTNLTACGSLRNEAAITTGYEVQQFVRRVFVGGLDLPAVAANACDGVVRLRGVEFAFDRAEITEVSKPVLNFAVDQLSSCPDIRIRIDGHTDSIGSAQYNDDLSLRRAEATRQYFIQSGIAQDRLQTRGAGESQPLASNGSAEGRAQNRRVELISEN